MFFSLPSAEIVSTVALPEGARPPALYSPDGSQIAVGIAGYFALLDAATGDLIRFLGSEMDGHFVSDYVADIDVHYAVFTTNGSGLISGSLDSNLFWWDVDTGELIQRLIGHEASIIGIENSPDEQEVITLSGDGNLRFWDLLRGGASEAQETFQRFDGHKHWNVFDLDVSPEGEMAVSISNGEPNRTRTEAILWDTSTLEVIRKLPGVFLQAAFLPNGESVILAGLVGGTKQEDYDNPEMLLVHWDVINGREIGRLNTGLSVLPWDIAISPDGKLLMVAPGEEETYQFDIETLTQLKKTPHRDGVNFSVAFRPDGRSALYGNNIGVISRWNHHTTHEESPFPIERHYHGGLVLSLAFSQDGERFVSASTDQTIVLWDVASGQAIRTFNGHTDAVNSVAFTPDESQIISGSADGTLILWDVASGEALRTFSEHSAGVTKVALSPDGQLAYSAAQDGLVIVRPIGKLAIDDVLAFIEDNRVHRAFSCEEREQYRILPLCSTNGDLPDTANYNGETLNEDSN
jgi:WD40 repeat protein